MLDAAVGEHRERKNAGAEVELALGFSLDPPPGSCVANRGAKAELGAADRPAPALPERRAGVVAGQTDRFCGLGRKSVFHD